MIFKRVIAVLFFFNQLHQYRTNNNHDVYNIANEIRRNIKGNFILKNSFKFQMSKEITPG